MINLYPAIDLFNGKVVRLARGEYDQMSVYSDSPADQAKVFENDGARWLHVIDLEGAKMGMLKNLAAVKNIRGNVRCKIQVGGGIRKVEDIETLLEAGANRVILGTKALDPAFITQALDRWQDRIAVSLDVRRGMIQTEGWLKAETLSLTDMLARLAACGLETLIYTDTQKDGMLKGPNLEGIQTVLKATRARVILAGGISSLSDIKDCLAVAASNFEGVIIGKALYEKRLTLREAILLTHNANGKGHAHG